MNLKKRKTKKERRIITMIETNSDSMQTSYHLKNTKHQLLYQINENYILCNKEILYLVEEEEAEGGCGREMIKVLYWSDEMNALFSSSYDKFFFLLEFVRIFFSILL